MSQESKETTPIISPAATVPPIDKDSPTAANPWRDATDSDSEKDVEKEEHHTLQTPDPETLDPTVSAGIHSISLTDDSESAKPPVSKDVLNEFDPLANSVELEAQQAWAQAESHPPPPPKTPPPADSTLAPAPPVKDLLVSPPDSPQSGTLSPSSAFPSFSSFAKSFAIPGLGKPRPLSLDAAKPVASPATLSSLAAQQETAAHSQEQPSSRAGTPTTGGAPATSGSGTTSPSPENRPDGEVPFDFQKFLDQMKSRNAEPVSKYLRSYVYFYQMS
jgi:Rab5 GDP/GTP exchange factor